jgi:hypothetical protein
VAQSVPKRDGLREGYEDQTGAVVLIAAEIGRFTAAAEELHISQSSLSKQIIALEKRLGFPLFDRSRRKIALTQAGKTILNHAVQGKRVVPKVSRKLAQVKLCCDNESNAAHKQLDKKVIK